jgi:hypothetical protein
MATIQDENTRLRAENAILNKKVEELELKLVAPWQSCCGKLGFIYGR